MSKRIILSVLLIIGINRKAFEQVSLQTGASQFSLPFFSYGDNNGLHTFISLDYMDGNGLKVTEKASAVGTGWNLICGGVITREQHGLPDDQKRSPTLSIQTYNGYSVMGTGGIYQYETTYFPNGYIFSNYQATDGLTNEATLVRMMNSPTFSGYLPQEEQIAADREQDVFHLSIGKGDIAFVIGKDLHVTILNDAKVNIALDFTNMLSSGIKTWISKFTVTDVDGIQYIFDKLELSETCTYDHKRNPDNWGIVDLTDPTEMSAPPPNLQILLPGQSPQQAAEDHRTIAWIGRKSSIKIVTKWYLSQIFNPRSSAKVIFTYENYSLETQNAPTLSFYEGSSILFPKEILSTLRIKKIEFPDKSNVEFNYEDYARIDVPQMKPLKQIEIKQDDHLLYSYDFNYKYFFRSTLKEYNYPFDDPEKFMARLCLASVKKNGVNSTCEEPYTFQYYTGSSTTDNSWDHFAWNSKEDMVPPVNSFYTDHWGYYNSLNTFRDLNIQEGPANWAPTRDAIRVECLNASRYKSPADGEAKNGIIKIITYPTKGSLTFEYEQNSAYYGGFDVPAAGVRVKSTTQFDGIDHSNDIVKEYKYTKDDRSSGWGYEIQTYELENDRFVYPTSAGSPNVNFTGFATGIATKGLQGSLINTPGGMGGITVSAQAGIRAAIIAIVVQIIIELITDWNSGADNDTPIENDGIEYNNVSFRSVNPLLLLYSRVEVVEKLNGSEVNGKTVFQFTSDQDIDLLEPVLNLPFSSKPRYYSSYYGLPKKISVFDQEGRLLKETLNNYELKTRAGDLSMYYTSTKSIYDKFPFDETNWNHEALIKSASDYPIIERYSMLIDHTELTSTISTILDKTTSDFQQSITEYTYDSKNLQVSTEKTKDSKGNIIEKRYYYPANYATSQDNHFINEMVQKNMINNLISTETWRTKPGMTEELLNINVNEYGLTTSDDYKPTLLYKTQNKEPIPLLTVGEFNGMLLRDHSTISPQLQLSYDKGDNIIKSIDLSGNRITGVIYDRTSYRYPIAQVVNASPDEVAYTSFEEPYQNQSSYHNWYFQTFCGTIVTEGMAPTGTNYLRFYDDPHDAVVCDDYATIASSIKADNKDYVLTFWANSSDFLIYNNGAQIANGPTINGWTYYEYAYPQGSDYPKIALLPNTGIDEIRFYPKNATLYTSTYTQGIGRNSECDINNRIRYYEYDGLGRMKIVKDESRNVIKTYEYHYKN